MSSDFRSEYRRQEKVRSEGRSASGPLSQGLIPEAESALLRAAIDSPSAAVIVVDASWRILAVSRRAEQLLGCREAELRGTSIAEETAHPSSGKEVGAGGLEPGTAAADAAGDDRVTWFRGPDGRRFEVSLELVTATDGSTPLGGLLHFLESEPATSCDVALRLTEERLRAVLDTIMDGVIVMDEQGIVEFINPAAETLFGYASDEVLGRSVNVLVPQAHELIRQAYVGKGLFPDDREARVVGRELSGRRKDGSRFPVLLSIGAMDQGGRCLFVGVTHDVTRRKQAEEKLLTLSFAVEQSPSALLIAAVDGRVEYVNRRFTQLTGYTPVDVAGKDLRFLAAAGYSPNKFKRIWRHIEARTEWRGEVQDQKKHGEPYWALEAIAPVRNSEGEITHYLSIQQDITEQKRDREALRESEERFRQVAEMTGEWLWEQDPRGRYIYSSGAVLDILGYEPNEIIGKSYLDLLTARDRVRWKDELIHPVDGPQPFCRLVNHYRHKDGHDVYTQSTGAPLFDASGVLVKWRGVDHDITTRKQYEDALRLRERAIEEASVGIAISDAQLFGYPNIYVNPALCRMTGYSRDELLLKNMTLLQGPDTDPAALEKIRRALREAQSCEVVIKNYRKDGTPFWNELILSPVRDEHGIVTHYIGVQTDVTERRRAEEQRQQLEIARKIQLSLLPKKPLVLQGAELAGVCLPASHVGGDYFDFFQHNSVVDLAIGDVSGHSVGAALIMAEARSTLRAEARKSQNHDPDRTVAQILRDLNVLLYEDLTGSELFITMFYLKYDLETRRLTYANAGHPSALLLRADAPSCTQLDAEGLVLGVKNDVVFEEGSVHLEPNDVVFLYTDGITEAQNEAGEFFGTDRLCQLFSACRDHAPQALIERVLTELRLFSGRAPLHDDISLVVLKIP